ncbi:MAG: HEAT repeat domain-containing protein [Ignavibacteriae bacterium]|nr:HEAT repeat domain-containing protein [Ignavibacteriota bacterium]
MKNISKLLVLLLSVLLASTSFGFSKDKLTQIEDNLLVGINTENTGLQISCAYFLGELKSERAINPLLKMLKSGETEEERIIAALSLSKIQTDKAIFAVKQRARFDDSERVQRLCGLFYNCCMARQQKADVIVEPFQVVNLNLEFNGMRLADFAN